MFICTNCKSEYSKWQGQCANCGEWNTLEKSKETVVRGKRTSKDISGLETKPLHSQKAAKRAGRSNTNIKEFDRVLGGGFVPGEVILLAGSPGIGKSTILLQVAAEFAKKNKTKVLYVAGEESFSQISNRAERLKSDISSIEILEDRNVDEITAFIHANNKKYGLCIIDSIQTVHTEDLNSSSGSISQVTECASRISDSNKKINLPTILVGHVTKGGSIAGPKTLEHLVDAVLELEGDKFHQFRLLRGSKNRFGSVDEVGVFEMSESGLKEVKNPSDSFLSERKVSPGSAVTVIMEGTRPMLFEVQALVTKSYFPNPRRTASGFDYNRLILLCAVLEKRVGYNLSEKDVYINISGGAKVSEPAADLAVCLAIASSVKDKALPKNTVVFGEVGLLGEVRKVPFMDKRIKESKKLGYTSQVSPQSAADLKSVIKKFTV